MANISMAILPLAKTNPMAHPLLRGVTASSSLPLPKVTRHRVSMVPHHKGITPRATTNLLLLVVTPLRVVLPLRATEATRPLVDTTLMQLVGLGVTELQAQHLEAPTKVHHRQHSTSHRILVLGIPPSREGINHSRCK